MKMKLFGALASALVIGAVEAVEWANVDEAHHLAGRRCSSGYLQGKVVLVDRWGAHCPPCRALLPHLADIWNSYRTKQFVLLSGHCPGWGTAEEVKELADRAKANFPIYEGACLANGEPKFNAIPFLYVVDETGYVRYRGHSENDAVQAVVEAITDMASPKDVTAWQRYLDYELKELPGRAYLRAEEFKKAHPEEAKEYDEKIKELKAIPDVKKLSELVAFAQKAKDMRAFTAKQKIAEKRFAKAIKDAISKYSSLKTSKNEKVAREAKNALADLAWTEAAL